MGLGAAMATNKRKMRRVAAPVRAAIQRVHDRRSQDLPINALVAPITVDDPHGIESGEKIVVLRSLRDDPVGAMHARGQVDEAQYAAARHWQRLYEMIEIAGARAIDPTKEAVDGGGIPQSTTPDSYSHAWAQLTEADKALGQDRCALVRDVLGSGMILLHVGAKRHLQSEYEYRQLGHKFRDSLDVLSVVFGYAMPR